MISDEIIKEVWQIRDAYASEYDNDLDKIFDDLKKREKNTSHPLVDFSKDQISEKQNHSI